MVINYLYYYISHLINLRGFKYGISFFNSYFIFYYNNSLFNNVYSVFNCFKVVEF